jgi:YegS/Rv2252/BmrU family lipid kinase
MEHSRKQVLLIVNPCAGPDSTRRSAEDIVRHFPADEFEIEIKKTKGHGDATELVRSFANDKDLVICCGGDGTLNETINGVMDLPRRIPIGYIPTGTTNDLASTLGISRDIEKAAALIRNGHTNSYDIGLFNNRYYSYVAAFGAFTRSSYATKQWMKNIFGHFAYLLNGVFKEWKNISSTHMKIEYDDGEMEGDFSFGSISNSTSISGIFRLNKDEVKLNDGYFEVLLVRKARVSEAPSLFNKIRKKEYDGKRIILLKTSKVKITADAPIAWTLDGEYGGEHQTVMVHVLSKAIDICSPADNVLFERPQETAAPTQP